MLEMLDEDMLLGAAAAHHGLADPVYSPGTLEGLAVQVRALRLEAELNEVSLMQTLPLLIQALSNDALVNEAVRRHPEIEQVQVEAPLVIVGLPRTGTTLLQNLLARDPANRCPALWELRAPAAPPDAPDDWAQHQRAQTDELLDFIYTSAPSFKLIHPMHTDAPDECSWLMRNTFASLVNAFSHHAPSYADWFLDLEHGAMVQHYGSLKRQLQAILWRRPGARLVLKDPHHLANLPALLEIFPDARVVHTHRAMSEAVPSAASLCAALTSIGAQGPDEPKIGRYVARILDKVMARMTQARDHLPASSFFDLRYLDLIRDPVGKALEVETWAGRPPGPEAEAAMRAWLADNAQHKHGRHRYTPAQYGLDPDALERRYADYTARYL
jgi:hypothetical protein